MPEVDLHHVKPEYLKKLEALRKEGTVSSAEFEKKFGVDLRYSYEVGTVDKS